MPGSQGDGCLSASGVKQVVERGWEINYREVMLSRRQIKEPADCCSKGCGLSSRKEVGRRLICSMLEAARKASQLEPFWAEDLGKGFVQVLSLYLSMIWGKSFLLSGVACTNHESKQVGGGEILAVERSSPG